MSAAPPPDERNPLARALDAASNGPEARAYAIPVEAVRAGARRRRARRTGGLATAAVVVVGAVVGGAALAGLPRGGNPALPGPGDTGGTSVADWPAQFARCGKPADEVLPDAGDKLAIGVDEQTESMPADGQWHGVVTAALMPPNDGLGPAHVWPTDLTVVSDGIVVGVQAGGGAPDLAELAAEGDVLAGDTVALPTTTQVNLRIASCDPYPSGQGTPDLAPGTYDLVVTQTVSYRGVEGRQVDERDSTTTTLAITDATGAVPDATACSTSDDLLAALADPEANPRAFPLDAETTGEGLVGQPLPMAFSIPEGAADFLGDGLVMSKVQAVLTQDHVVVGQAEQAGGGASLTFGVPQDCSLLGPPRDGSLAAGDYEVWVVLDVHPTGPVTPDVRVAAGPWPVTLDDHPTPGTPTALTGPFDAAAVGAATDAVFRCGQPVDTASAADETELTLQAPAPAGTWAWVPPRWPMTVATTPGETRDFWLVTQPRLAVLDGQGRYVGVATVRTPGSGADEATRAAGGTGVSVQLADSDTWSTYGCVDGVAQLSGAEEGFKGPHRAIPYVVVDLGDGPVVLLGDEVDAPFASQDAFGG